MTHPFMQYPTLPRVSFRLAGLLLKPIAGVGWRIGYPCRTRPSCQD
jgi:hypothetical protein